VGGRECRVEKNCETGRFQAASERVAGVVNQQRKVM